MTTLHPPRTSIAFVDNIEALLSERLDAEYRPHPLQESHDLPKSLWNDRLKCHLLDFYADDATGVITLILGKDSTTDFKGAVTFATESQPDAVLILCVTQARPDHAYARTVDGGWKALNLPRRPTC
ncbi:motility associated factor glycosyltransferase family protein [Burkholderia ambifaria]|uniref:hypothetical protein n=1 Tax=Burkholderia ambifaria TaxID=152480 RepID=UPI00158DE12C|nr:hypothetical protein [Burkholderia ambifaria]